MLSITQNDFLFPNLERENGTLNNLDSLQRTFCRATAVVHRRSDITTARLNCSAYETCFARGHNKQLNSLRDIIRHEHWAVPALVL